MLKIISNNVSLPSSVLSLKSQLLTLIILSPRFLHFFSLFLFYYASNSSQISTFVGFELVVTAIDIGDVKTWILSNPMVRTCHYGSEGFEVARGKDAVHLGAGRHEIHTTYEKREKKKV